MTFYYVLISVLIAFMCYLLGHWRGECDTLKFLSTGTCGFLKNVDGLRKKCKDKISEDQFWYMCRDLDWDIVFTSEKKQDQHVSPNYNLVCQLKFAELRNIAEINGPKHKKILSDFIKFHKGESLNPPRRPHS